MAEGGSIYLFILFKNVFCRRKTTNGIWIAKAPDIEPLTVVLDLEGTDGKERGAVSI